MSERVRVLITVKAAPEPSRTYIDTVCVAGVRIDCEPHEWIRLYPVPFRHLSSEQQFAKFQVVELEVNPARSDSRRESRRPIWDSLGIAGPALRLAARASILEPMQTKSMCDLSRDVRRDSNAQSLGLVKVRQIDGLDFEPHPGWTDRQKAAMVEAMQPTLFDEQETSRVRSLEPPRFKVFYRYRCVTADCPGHRQSILDFEMAALQYRGRHASDDDLKASVRRKFLEEKFAQDKRTSLFVGNIADPVKRKSYSALGVFTVPVGSDFGSTLF